MTTTKTYKGARWSTVLAAVTVIAAAQLGAETFVLPVVVRGVPGINGSFWDSEVRIMQLNLAEPVTVKRLWVATAAGGFADDPTTAPSWSLPFFPANRGLAILTGADLLQGVDATHAAIALDVQGKAAVIVHNSNTLGAGRLPPEFCCLPGNGQLTSALTAPIQGPSIIPWATSGKEVFRVNVGIINPNPVSATFHIRSESFGNGAGDSPYWTPWAEATGFDVVLPPWGWIQVNDVFALLNVVLQPGPGSGTPLENWLLPASVIIGPLGDLPYYAYATPIYSPLNDPEFIVAEPLVQ
jgi:hypothetical protein